MTKRKVNVLSNELDQAPKTRAAGYGKVVDSMRKEISEAMEQIFMHGSDVICEYINDFVNKGENVFIRDSIVDLKPGDSLSFEIKREKVENEQSRREPAGHPVFWGFEHFIHNFYGKSGDGPLEPGEVSTAIIIEKDVNDPYLLKVHAEQLEVPRENALISKGALYHNPNVSDEKFQEIIGKKSDKN